MNSPWTQLEGVEQILPGSGWEFEQMRRRLLDCLYQNGYELVIPPLADFVETLLGGTNEDLDVLTVKSPDHVSGRLFGIRADMTPQVARIAATHTPVQDAVVRLCYFGPVLLARAMEIGGRREQMQFGAELFGSESLKADCEIVQLMVESLRVAGADSLVVSLGHVGIVEEIFRMEEFNDNQQETVQKILQRKSKPDLQLFCEQNQLSSNALRLLRNLIDLNGDESVLDTARLQLGKQSSRLDHLLDEFASFLGMVRKENEPIPLHVDFAQTGSHRYHTGIIFSAFVPGFGQAVAKGGRYDNVMSAYGTPCAATGFSGDLMLLAGGRKGDKKKGILVPADAEVPRSRIEELLANGERVFREMPGQSPRSVQLTCDHTLVKRGDGWQVESLKDKE